MKDLLKNKIEEALKNLGITGKTFVLEHPADSKNGDYSTNISLACAKELGKSPREVAEMIVAELSKEKIDNVERIDIAGAGFINFYLTRDFFVDSVKNILKEKDVWGKGDSLAGKKVMVEYTDPNPFKPFHIGHLMTNAIGESIARIFEFSGAHTIRANYQGDVGLHVAKAIWRIKWFSNDDTEEYKKKRASSDVSAVAQWIGENYTEASAAYDAEPEIKKQIDDLNKQIYEKSDPEINDIYEWGKDVTLKAFEGIYKILGTKFDHYFFESEMAPIGAKIVRENVGKVFDESDSEAEQARNGAGAAIVFHGEKYDEKLHTRVFITSQGLPTYETKEIGLTMTKFQKENPDLSIVITAVEQGEYMKVVAKALSLMHPDYESRMKHLTHGMMRFATEKMSSRKGNVITGESLLEDSREAIREKVADREWDDATKEEVARIVGVAALKYSILRQALGGNIIYDKEKSFSFEGDSGPYLEYSATRANSVLKKAESSGVCVAYKDVMTDIFPLERYLYQFPEVVERASETFEPHHIVTYLIELSACFNAFYGNYPIVNSSDPYSPYKVALTEAFYTTMKNGLWLLGIEVPKCM